MVNDKKLKYWQRMAIVTKQDLDSGIKDSKGVLYSEDGKRLLKGCDLPRYTIKEGVEVICNGAFNDCYPINAVKFPKSLKYIGDRAFHSTFIDRMSFPDGLLGIGELAFAFMRGRAKEIVIPDSVIYIGSSAFCKMSNLKKVQIGTGLNVIESFLFVGCFELKSIILPDTITAIRDSAFDGCPIKEIAIPRNVNEIGTNPFIETKKIGCLSDNFIFEDNVLYSKDKKELIICNTRKKKFKVPEGVKVIRPLAFSNSEVESVILPESVKEIGKEAFCHSKLKTIKLPRGIRAIGDCAFAFSDLESLYMPDSITRIGGNAFEWCENLQGVRFPENLEEVGNEAFYLCKNLRDVQLPDKLRIIGNSAFANCYQIKAISLPESVESIGWNPFEQIEDLQLSCLTKNYKFENGILYSADGRIVICYIGSHDEIKIPEGVELIGSRAFSSRHVTSVSLPSTIREIGERAFAYCRELSEINIPESLLTIGKEAFKSCKQLKEIVIPDSVLTIGESAFSSCCDLDIKSLPKHLRELSPSTFFQCGITELLLPEDLEIIGDKAFS